MPSLFDVAKHFDDVAVTDGYSAAALFLAQFSTAAESSKDGIVTGRRIMSLAPDKTAPARGVISALGERSLMGMGVTDSIFGAAIRKSYWTKAVTDSFTKLTPGQAALDSAGTLVYSHKRYLKDTVNTPTDGEYDPFWELYFATAEAVAKGAFFKSDSTYYRVRSSHTDPSGLTVALSDELDAGARVSIAFNETGTYNPVTDSYSAGSTTVYGMFFDRYKLYDQLSQADRLSTAGDMTALVATSSITPAVGRNCVIASVNYKILNVTAELDAWELHLRRV